MNGTIPALMRRQTPGRFHAGRLALRRQTTEIRKNYVRMSEDEVNEAADMMAVLIIQRMKSKGKQMQRVKTKPALRMMMLDGDPDRDLPALYDRLGNFIRFRGEIESKLKALQGEGASRSKRQANQVRSLESEYDRVQKEIFSIDNQIREIETHRRSRNHE